MDRQEQLQDNRTSRFSWGAVVYGWLVAVAVSALLTALIVALGGSVALTTGVPDTVTRAVVTAGIGSAILLVVAMLIAYYAGGYVAGRMAIVKGAVHGFGVWAMGVVVALVLAALGALLGSNFNLMQQLNLWHIPVDQGSLTATGVMTLVAGLVLTLLAAMSGSQAGERSAQSVARSELEPGERVAGDAATADDTVVFEPDPATVRPVQGRAVQQPSFGERIESRPRRTTRDRMER